jgi:hypothetical protein
VEKKETNFLAGFKMRATMTIQRAAMAVRVEKQLKNSIRNASRCTQEKSARECVFFWEVVDDLTKAGHDQCQRVRDKRLDPLELFCAENPSEPECKAFDI